jgi:hypothetical protein
MRRIYLDSPNGREPYPMTPDDVDVLIDLIDDVPVEPHEVAHLLRQLRRVLVRNGARPYVNQREGMLIVQLDRPQVQAIEYLVAGARNDEVLEGLRRHLVKKMKRARQLGIA